jgi:hemerythrin superfamily protein
MHDISEHFVCAGHAAFGQRLADITARARKDDWVGLPATWDAFADDLVAHMDYEESEVFEDFGRESRQQNDALAELLRDHTGLRRLVAELGPQMRAGRLDEATFAAFLTLLREHSLREEATVYPWLEQRRGRRRR